MSDPLISAVIATFNRKDVLQMNLEHLAKQTLPASDFEVVLVDDGSSDGTEEMIKAVQPELPFALRYIKQQNQGPGSANNHGAREAGAQLICFIADDILASPPLLESHLDKHREKPQLNVAVVGKLMESPDVPQTVFQKAWDPFKGVDLENKEKHDELSFWVSNLSFKREFFLEKGLFFEFPGPAMEDFELAHRMFKQGLELTHSSSALGYHYHPHTIDIATRRSYLTGLNFMMFESRVDSDIIHKFANIRSARLGLAKYIRVVLRDMLRLSLFNGLTVPYLVVPTIKKAETLEFLGNYVEFLTRRACGYYLRKGIAESRKEWNKNQLAN